MGKKKRKQKRNYMSPGKKEDVLLVQDPSRCGDCNKILLTQAGFEHVQREMIDYRLKGKSIRRDLRDGIDTVDFDAIMDDLGYLICNGDRKTITQNYLDIIVKQESKRKRLSKRTATASHGSNTMWEGDVVNVKSMGIHNEVMNMLGREGEYAQRLIEMKHKLKKAKEENDSDMISELFAQAIILIAEREFGDQPPEKRMEMALSFVESLNDNWDGVDTAMAPDEWIELVREWKDKVKADGKKE